MEFDWPGLLVSGVSVAEKVLRTLVVFVFLVVALRLAGKREIAQLNPFDFIVLLVLSNTLQNAVIGPDNSVTGGFLGAGVLLALNWGVNRLLSGHPGLEHWLTGRKRVLVARGRVDHAALKKEMLTLEELELAAHKQGISRLSDVETAELDPDGSLFFVAKDSASDAHRHKELLQKLEALTREVAELKIKLGGA